MDQIPPVISPQAWHQFSVALERVKSRLGAPPKLADRDFLEAVLYLRRTRTAWRDLPAQFGKWESVYRRFRRWEKQGIWQRLHEQLQFQGFGQARKLFLSAQLHSCEV